MQHRSGPPAGTPGNDEDRPAGRWGPHAHRPRPRSRSRSYWRLRSIRRRISAARTSGEGSVGPAVSVSGPGCVRVPGRTDPPAASPRPRWWRGGGTLRRPFVVISPVVAACPLVHLAAFPRGRAAPRRIGATVSHCLRAFAVSLPADPVDQLRGPLFGGAPAVRLRHVLTGGILLAGCDVFRRFPLIACIGACLPIRRMRPQRWFGIRVDDVADWRGRLAAGRRP